MGNLNGRITRLEAAVGSSAAPTIREYLLALDALRDGADVVRVGNCTLTRADWLSVVAEAERLNLAERLALARRGVVQETARALEFAAAGPDFVHCAEYHRASARRCQEEAEQLELTGDLPAVVQARAQAMRGE